MSSERKSVKQRIKFGIMWLICLLFFKVVRKKDDGGYYMIKRWVPFFVVGIIALPVILLIKGLRGVGEYIIWVASYYSHSMTLKDGHSLNFKVAMALKMWFFEYNYLKFNK